MTKSDLKTGMWAKTRDALWMIVVIDNEPYLIKSKGWQDIQSFPNVIPGQKEWDILAVYDYFTDEYNNKAGSLQYDIFKDQVEDPNSRYFKKIWEASRETIKIGDITYDKQEFENAVKDLKPIK